MKERLSMGSMMNTPSFHLLAADRLGSTLQKNGKSPRKESQALATTLQHFRNAAERT
jgi:hypothetical protein